MITRAAIFRLFGACALLALGACVFSVSFSNSQYPACHEDGGCHAGCSCLAGQICVPDETGLGPESCTDECTEDTDCQNGCLCQEYECQPPVQTDDPDYCTDTNHECERDSDCLYGCHCQDFACEPSTGQPDNYCDQGFVECQTGADCRMGCICSGAQCVSAVSGVDDGYCAVATTPTCMQPDLWVDTDLDQNNQPPNGLTLRQALEAAAASPGPHRIAFREPDRFDFYKVDATKGPLPPVPALTYLDGGAGVILRPLDMGGLVSPGLTVGGKGVAISDIEIDGFSEYGLRIGGGASDVHLFRMLVDGTLVGAANGNGIEIVNTEHVTIGRGRELECIAPNVIPLIDPPDFAGYDINVIVANGGDGIYASNVDGLNIYGTWVGFDNVADPGHHNFSLGNGGVGIHLENVTKALVGAQRLTASETLAGPDDPLAGFVGVGRNQGGGVWVLGGGEISMPGLMIGDTPVMDPYDENHQFNLKIEANSGPVSYGPAPAADGPSALYFGLIYSESVPPISILNNEAEVWIRGVQNECFQNSGCPPYGVVIENPHAPVKLFHMTFVYDFPGAGVRVEGLIEQNASVELVNNLLFRMQAGSAAVVEVNSSQPEKLQLRHNMSYHFGDWCIGQCDGLDLSSDTSYVTFICNSNKAIPLDPDCPNVDAGEPIEVDGHQLNLTGDPSRRVNGCGPDIGFIECDTPDCLGVTGCD